MTRQDISMKANGRITWPMEEGRPFTVMKASTMESSSTIKGTATECSCRTSASLKDSLSAINCRALPPCKTKMDRAILVSGRITKNTGRECTNGQTAIDTKVSTRVEREKALESCSTRTDRLMKEIG